MMNTELVSRSQLLLQYLLAVDVTNAAREPFDYSADTSEGLGAAGNAE